MLKLGKPLMRPSEVDLTLDNARLDAMVPKAPASASSALVSLLLILGLFGLAMGRSMTLLGGPRAAFLGTAGTAGGRTVEVGSFLKQTGTGNQDVAITSALNGAAAGSWAIVLWWDTYITQTSGVWQAAPTPGIGYIANGGGSVSQYSATVSMSDNAATSDTARRMAAAAVTMVNTAAVLINEGTFTSFIDSTHMRFNWSTNVGDDSQINYMIISGLDNAKVVNWTTPTSATTKSVNTVGFTPSLVLHASNGDPAASLPSSATDAYFAFGMMNDAGEQASNSIVSADGAAAANTSRWQRTDACLNIVNQSEATNIALADYDSMDAAGFTVNFTTSSATAKNVISLCMSGIESKIGAFDQTASAAPVTQTITSNHGFDVVGAVFSSCSVSSGTTPAVHAIWSLGATDLTNERAVALNDNDAADPTQADSVWVNDKAAISVYESAGSPGIRFAADLAAVTSTSFDLGVTTNAGAGHQILYLLVG